MSLLEVLPTRLPEFLCPSPQRFGGNRDFFSERWNRQRMAQACSERDLPFVHISTDYVFDGQETRPWKITGKTYPLGAYGRPKLAGEQGIRAAGGRTAILLTSWVL
ncbi:sugar nucleotide-binding protein [uncultured Shimia sp.]|uniref:sugar nucleotide-binding protein n=1 Tax=uncultured Shimia sp. TaxID=573152 RepID=UPI00263696C4|nr:sugar nucleotide-binding protein [uncultured Shimia sp.]